ncbi:hypothetical protein OROHE_023481 [Orobanche hederae]
MKIQCDVCAKDEASLFCIADEAALCAACDHRVHHANKLAGKHQRFSLHNPSPNEAPLCDICQARRAFLFCQQDRAVLCRECDVSIHKASEHTQKHTRFLLTGIKLSATSSFYSSSASHQSLSNVNPSDAVPYMKQPEESKSTKPACLNAPTGKHSAAKGRTTNRSTTVMAPERSNDVQLMNGGAISASSISEYLEMLPGWHVEDFLRDCSSAHPSPYGFSQNGDNEVVLLPFWDKADIHEGNNTTYDFPSEKKGFYYVPQGHQPHLQQTLLETYDGDDESMEVAFGLANGFIDHSKEFTTYNNSIKCTIKRSEDNSFTVPQISPHSIVSNNRSSSSSSPTFYYY